MECWKGEGEGAYPLLMQVAWLNTLLPTTSFPLLFLTHLFLLSFCLVVSLVTSIPLPHFTLSLCLDHFPLFICYLSFALLSPTFSLGIHFFLIAYVYPLPFPHSFFSHFSLLIFLFFLNTRLFLYFPLSLTLFFFLFFDISLAL